MNDPTTTTDEFAGDVADSGTVLRAPLRTRHPAELTTFLAGVLALAAAVGLDLNEEQLFAALAVVTGLPAIATWLVNLYRDAKRQLGE